jgi:hypothetical protein
MQNRLFRKSLVIGITLILLAIVLSGCIEKDIVEGTGEVKYIDLEGGFYGIVSDDGENYDPLNLPDEFKQDGLRVRFKARVAKNQNSFHMWGKLVYILEIEKLEEGKLINYTGCIEFQGYGAPSDKDCIEYEYDGEDVLLLTHVNAGFNCCPEITADITIVDNIITIEEIEISGDCDCLCLFDVYYEIINLEPGEYTILVVEPYLHEDEEILEFTVDLSSSTSGSYCVDRYHYPWGE